MKRSLWRWILVLALTLPLGGCLTSRRYKMAKSTTPPAQLLGWQASLPPIDLTLTSVIVYHGPGSWKRDARWDEYIVQLTNRGDQPVTVASAHLVDLQGAPQLLGDQPWQLEELSRSNWERYGLSGLKLMAGAGVLVIYGAMLEGVATAYAVPGALVTTLSVFPVVLAVDVTAVAIMNRQNRRKVQAEFDRRRLRLPLTLAPGATVQGSFFFPMTPGPQRLVVIGAAGDTRLEVRLGLEPFAHLHLKPE